jgi:arylsulfatase A-like enzyme
MQKRNLLVFLPDQHSRAMLGCYGHPVVETPNLDGLAADGVRFDRAYCTQPVCTPSRSAIMTGQYPHTTGLTENNTPLPADARCLPELGDFDDYATAYMGKWDLGDEIFPQHGFEEWVAIEDGYRDQYTRGSTDERSDYHEFLLEEGYEPEDGTFSRSFAAELPEEHTKTAFLADRAIEFVEDNADRPFILYVAPLWPHSPYTSPRDDQYDPAAVPFPPNFDHEGFSDQSIRHRGARAAHAHRSETDWRALLARYCGLVSLVDTHVGRVLDAVDDHGLTDRTVTVYTSDHGDMVGHQRIMGKNVMFEQSIGVPLIVRAPGVEGGRTVEDPVSQIDLVPTLCDALGQSRPDHLQGNSLLALLQGHAEEPPEPYVVVEQNGPDAPGIDRRKDEWPDRGSRPTPRQHLIDRTVAFATEAELRRAYLEPVRTVIAPDGKKLNYYRDGERELYDLTADPSERDNLATDPDHEEVVEELTGKMFDWQVRTRDPIYLPS